MSEQHTPGRLSLEEVENDTGHIKHQCLVDSEVMSMLTIVEHQGSIFAAVYKDADARRLAACWNACDGISTDALERGPTPTEAFQREEARADLADRQRDELAKALHDLLDVVTGQKEGEAIAVMNAAAAIANTTGSAT